MLAKGRRRERLLLLRYPVFASALISEARLLVERSSELQRHSEARAPSSTSRPFGQKISHLLAVVWRVPNKALSQNDSESFHTAEEMTSRL